MNEMNEALRLAGDSGKALPRKMNFTALALAGVACPAGRRDIWTYDLRCPGLAYVVTASGKRSFYFVGRIRATGLANRIRIGGGGMTIEQARIACKKIDSDNAAGTDPAAARREVRESDTLDHVWARYLEDHVKLNCSASTQVRDPSMYRTCLKARIGSRRVLSITPAAVSALHLELRRDHGDTTANRAIQQLKRILNWAQVADNPCKGIRLAGEHSREVYLTGDALPRFFQALHGPDIGQDIRDILLTLLYTGARRGNVLSMRADEIDLTTRTWRIPADKFKTGKTLDVPLCDEVLDIVRPRMANKNGFIFASTLANACKPSACGHLVEIKASWNKVRRAAGLEHVHLHDLRHSLASWQVRQGASLAIVGRGLGHTRATTTQRYAHIETDAVRSSFERAVAAMKEAGNTAAPATTPTATTTTTTGA